MKGRLPFGPDIILLVADDHRPSAIGAYGNTDVVTPNLDVLASDGLRFTNVRCQGGMNPAICATSRACFLTGRQVWEAVESTAIDSSGSYEIKATLPTLPSLLGKIGYNTYAVGKWHNGARSFARSFRGGTALFFGGMSDHHAVPVQMFDPTGEYDEGRASVARGFSTDVFGNAAVEFLESPKDQRPYFLYVAFTAPHDPRTPVLPYSSMYRPDQLTLPPNVMQRHPFDNGALSGRDERLAPTVRSREIVAQHLADYYGMISHLDKAVGDIVSASRRSARGRDTVIIYTADHGLALGNHGLMGKQNLYDHSLRIPLIITGVGHSGSVESSLWYNSDVYRTIGTIGGVPGLDDCPSQDMLSGLQGREYVFGAYKDLQRSAIGHAWKLIRYYKSETSGVGTERAQLFDLGTDPFELNDRSSDPGCSGTLEELKSELEMWQVQHNDPLANIRSDA